MSVDQIDLKHVIARDTARAVVPRLLDIQPRTVFEVGTIVDDELGTALDPELAQLLIVELAVLAARAVSLLAHASGRDAASVCKTLARVS